MALTTFSKDPHATLDYNFDWSDWLASGEALTSSVFTRSATNLKQTNVSLTTSIATVWLTNGAAGATYTLANKIGTDAGRIDERTVNIKVLQR